MEPPHQPHSSFFFFPNYESHFPAEGGPRAGTRPHDSLRAADASDDLLPRLKKPGRVFGARHPAAAAAAESARTATERILRCLFEATNDFTLGPFADDHPARPSGASLASNFANSSARIPLVAFLKKFWQTA